MERPSEKGNSRRERITLVIAIWGALLGTTSLLIHLHFTLREYPSLRVYGPSDVISVAGDSLAGGVYDLIIVNEGFRPISIISIEGLLRVNPERLPVKLLTSPDTLQEAIKVEMPQEHQIVVPKLPLRLDGQEARRVTLRFPSLPVPADRTATLEYRVPPDDVVSIPIVLGSTYGGEFRIVANASYGPPLKFIRPVLIRRSGVPDGTWMPKRHTESE